MQTITKKGILEGTNLFIPTKFNIEKTPYTILKITPYKKGYNDKDFIKLINTISKYNLSFLDRFEFRKGTKEIVYKPNQPFSYEILFTKEKITFYYAIPTIYKTVFINKVKFLLEKCDIVEDKDYLNQFIDGYRYNFKEKKDWFMSLNTNENVNITDSLIVINKDLQENDKVLLQYLMKPMFDYEWKNKWDSKNNKYNSTGIVTGSFDFLGIIDKLFDFSLKHIDLLLNSIMMAFCGEEVLETEKHEMNFSNELNSSTRKKSIFDGFNTNINLFVKTDNPIVRDNITRNISTIMQDIEEDNSFTIEKGKLVKKEIQREIKKGFVTHTLECKQFIKLPSEKYIKEYEEILDIIKVEELDMPKELFNESGIPLGEMKKGSIYKPIGFGTHSNSLSKPLIYLGEQESGKSSFMRGYGINALEQGHSIFAFDTIDGKTVDIIRDHLPRSFPEDKIIILDFRNEEYIFPLLWDEVSYSYFERLQKAEDVLDKYRILEEFGGVISGELIRFIDTFEEDRSKRLSSSMKKILSEITQLVFMNQGNFGMVRDCLYDTELRHKLLNQLDIPLNLPFAKNILKLDDESDSSTTLRGITSRLNLIMENDTLKKYFSVSPNENNKLDFSKWANEGYCVIFNIPEEFADILVTFLVQKLWLAIKISRYEMDEDDRPHTHLLIDEPNKFPTIMSLLKDHIIASRKWHLRFLFFIHNMNVFRGMGENLISAGTSFIMLPTNQFNFNQVSDFFEPYDFSALKEVEKLIAKSDGKLRYALCSVHYKSANYPCVVKLPLPPEMRYKRIDRSHLNNECAKKYGISQREYYEELFNRESNETIYYEIDEEEVDI